MLSNSTQYFMGLKGFL